MSESSGVREGSALVTGASRGIGAAIARALAGDGWRVGVNYRADRSGAEAVVSEIESAGGHAVALEADVSDRGAADELFGALESHFDAPVLALVNNAGISRDDLTPSLGDEEWDSVLQTNLTSAFRLTRRALRPMIRARSGRIVNISSIAGLRANPGQANYSAAKAGVAVSSRVWAQELAPFGIRVVAIAPGFVRTGLIGVMSQEALEDVVSRVPMARLGEPEEIYAGLRFAIECDYFNGRCLDIDGGLGV